MELILIAAKADIKLGLIILIVGMGVVFSALAVLNIIFNQIPKIFKFQMRMKFRRLENKNKAEDCCVDISGETNAAIALALHLYMDEQHDTETNVMTITKVSKRYSPWSSKIYGLRNITNR